MLLLASVARTPLVSPHRLAPHLAPHIAPCFRSIHRLSPVRPTLASLFPSSSSLRATSAPCSVRLLQTTFNPLRLPRRRGQPQPPRLSPSARSVQRPSPPSSPEVRDPPLEEWLKAQEAAQEREQAEFWATQHIQPPSVSRALLFCTGFGLAAFTGAAYLSLRDTSEIAQEVRAHQGPFSNWNSFFSGTAGSTAEQETWGPGVTEKKLLVAKKHEKAERLGARMEWFVGWCDQLGLPEGVKEVVGRSYVMVAEQYLNLPTSKEVLLPIIALNTLVFLSWRLAPARGSMEHFLSRHFLHRPSSGRLYTMLTSTFSHRGGLHFLFNNFALWSIGGGALIYASHVHSDVPIIPEASRTPQFVAFFATAGVVAATASHVVTAVRLGSLVRREGWKVARGKGLARQSSLGASGAVYAALVMSACAFPEARISLIFLPFFSVPIGLGVSGLVAFDLVGALRCWPMFDHVAHLAGALFGYLYFFYGPSVWQRIKAVLIQRFRIADPQEQGHRVAIL
ncbi:hypothetical protein ACQY0O_003553 [Thecaphora frezii]